MKLVIATHNQGKVKEIRELFSRYYDTIVSLRDEGVAFEVPENGATFEANARQKALDYAEALPGRDVLADDSGLEVDALNGAPGVYSARYAGENATDAENNALLLKNLAGVPEKARTARFKCCTALVRGGEVIAASGACEGRILTEARGEGGFGYDPLFYVEEYDKTFAELTMEEKNALSHRGRALRNSRRAVRFRRFQRYARAKCVPAGLHRAFGGLRSYTPGRPRSRRGGSGLAQVSRARQLRRLERLRERAFARNRRAAGVYYARAPLRRQVRPQAPYRAGEER